MNRCCVHSQRRSVFSLLQPAARPAGLPGVRRAGAGAAGLLAGGRGAVRHRLPRPHRQHHLGHHPLEVSQSGRQGNIPLQLTERLECA